MATESKKGFDYEVEILDCIRDHPGGVTITDIANLKEYSRNTVSKYVSILELKKLVISRKIGAYKLYFSSTTSYLPRVTVMSYYKALLVGLKQNFPDQYEVFKEIGRGEVDNIKFAFGPNVFQELKKLKDIPFSKDHLDAFKNFFPSYDIFQPDIEISTLSLDPKEMKAIFRFKNSAFVETNDNFVYHIYLICGITEGILKKTYNIPIECEVENGHVGTNKEDSYFDLSIRLVKKS
jgi:Mn-dependent DtxR family transcriptional regulator